MQPSSGRREEHAAGEELARLREELHFKTMLAGELQAILAEQHATLTRIEQRLARLEAAAGRATSPNP
jgi:hypothetical protein